MYFWLASILNLLNSVVPEKVQYFSWVLVGNMAKNET